MKNPKNKKIIVAFIGPTASGKTELALKLAPKINAEIISYDSRQIYKYMNIGTAKPKKFEQKTVKHHLINILSPDEDFNAGEFVRRAEKIIQRLWRQNKIPLLVGGTGLYLKALIDGLCPSPPKDLPLRHKLERQAKKYGPNYLLSKLKRIDPDLASKTHPHNLRRIIRYLEVYYLTGKPISVWHQKTPPPKYKVVMIGLQWRRDKLYQRIDQRVEQMIKNGLQKETQNLLERKYKETLPALQTLGYKQIIEYLKGKTTLENAIYLIKRDTRHYAKRQISWFNKDKRIHWFKIESEEKLPEIVAKIHQLVKRYTC